MEKTNETFEHFRIVADPGQTPIRLDLFVMNKVEKASRNRIQNAIKQGAILVDDKQVKPNYKIKPGMVVTLSLPQAPRENEPVQPEDIPLDIRYEDEDIMVVHKPAGMTVHPGVSTPNGTLVNGLVHYFQNHELPVKAGNFNDRPGLVHRIDKDTTGLLVIAKNPEAMTHLSKQFFDHSTDRTYQALVWGEPENDEGTINGHLARDRRNPIARAVVEEDEGGKHAITHYKVIERLYYVSLVECRLETGRTHQIRAHFKHIGHPLFGDERYGGRRILKGTVFSKYRQFVENCFKIMSRQSLHAKSLGFIHPTTGEKMNFDSDLPEDFQALLSKWRNYVGGRKEIMDRS